MTSLSAVCVAKLTECHSLPCSTISPPAVSVITAKWSVQLWTFINAQSSVPSTTKPPQSALRFINSQRSPPASNNGVDPSPSKLVAPPMPTIDTSLIARVTVSVSPNV